MATNPLLQFDSPRRAYNSDEYSQTQTTVTLLTKGTPLTANLLLGPGIVIEQVTTGEGQVPYTKLSVSAEIAGLVATVAAHEARIDALESLFVAGVLTADTIEVRRIIAKGTGSPPDENVADLEIVTRHHALPDTYHQLFRVVGANGADMDPAPMLSFFGVDAQFVQTIPAAPTATEVKDRFVTYGLLVNL
jgi:hypothetical protein